jgi:ribosomal protein S18 acetylase RimI-like enzyme
MKITQLHVQIDSTEKTDVYLFAHADDEFGPVGMLVLGLEDGENTGWVSRVFVEPEYRQRGAAKELFKWATMICEQKQLGYLSLSVSDKNTIAQNAYLSMGFRPFMKGTEGYMQYIKQL